MDPRHSYRHIPRRKIVDAVIGVGYCEFIAAKARWTQRML